MLRSFSLLNISAINAKATQRSEESMREAEEMMRSLESPDVVAYQTCEYSAVDRSKEEVTPH
jgi:hypothetical protein